MGGKKPGGKEEKKAIGDLASAIAACTRGRGKRETTANVSASKLDKEAK